MVKRKILASICQKDLRLTKVSAQPLGSRISVSVPTEDSSLIIKPILSNFCKVFFPLKIPSLLILMRQSIFGLPNSGVKADSSVRTCGLGDSLWKYQHSVAQSIRAICLVGDAVLLKSVLEGMDMEVMNIESP